MPNSGNGRQSSKTERQNIAILAGWNAPLEVQLNKPHIKRSRCVATNATEWPLIHTHTRTLTHKFWIAAFFPATTDTHEHLCNDWISALLSFAAHAHTHTKGTRIIQSVFQFGVSFFLSWAGQKVQSTCALVHTELINIRSFSSTE